MENTKAFSSLYILAVSEDAVTLQRILDTNRDLDVNVKNIKGLTALQMALDRDSSVVRILLCSGADVNTTSKNGQTALEYAMKNNDASILEYLLAHNVSRDTKIDNYSLLHFAAYKNEGDSYFSIFEVLLKNGADVNLQNEWGDTPLHYLVDKAGVKTVRLLLNFKADVNIKNKDGHTAIFNAVRAGNFEVSKLLNEHGSDVKVVDESGCTLLDKAGKFCEGNSHFKVVKLLLKNGVDVNAQNQFGSTSLHYFARDANVKTVKLLLDYGADVNIRNYDNEIPLFGAIKTGKMEIVKLLIDQDSDVNTVTSENGWTPLYVAVAFKLDDDNSVYRKKDERELFELQLSIVKLLLSSKADINIKDKNGETFLFKAFEVSNFEIVQLLLDHGSIIDYPNAGGSTLLLEACRHNCRLEIVKGLLKNGANTEDLKSDLALFYDFMCQSCCQIDSGSRFLRFFFKYADMSVFNFKANPNIAQKCLFGINEFLTVCNRVLEHFAKLQMLNLPLIPSILNTISNDNNFKKYFDECVKELEVAKGTKLKNSWVSFFNLLVDSKRQLKNYAGNEDLIEDFKNNECKNKFKIYGAEMEKNVEKGIQRRYIYDDSTEELSKCLPVFNSTHLVIRDILDCISTKELIKFRNIKCWTTVE